MQKSTVWGKFKEKLMIGVAIAATAMFFQLFLNKTYTYGWLLGILFTIILQIYRNFMYPRIYHNFNKKIRVMFDLISHQLLVTLIVLIPFYISIKYRMWFDPIAVFLAFFCERIYWLVTHYLKEKRRV